LVLPLNTSQRHWSISLPNGQEGDLVERVLHLQVDQALLVGGDLGR
jgi:hypothetical protein